MLFGLHHSVLVTLFWWFYHSKIWVMRHKKKKQVSIVFNFHHPWFSGIFVNRVHQWAPRAVLCPITLCYDRWNWALNTTLRTVLWNFFFHKNFPLLTSLFSLPSLNLAPFSLPCWHSQRASSMAPQSMFEDWTRPEKWVRVWRTAPHRSSEPSLNLHRRVHLSIVVSIPLSPFPSCNIISQVQ